MNEQKNNGRGIFYGVIGVATLVVAIIGATFAYFTAVETAGQNEINGNMATISFSLSVTKLIDPGKETGIIPMSNSMVEAALTSTKGVCVDDNGNAVCQIYKIDVANGSTATMLVDGYVALAGGSGTPTDYPEAWLTKTGDKITGVSNDVKNVTTMRWAQVFATTSGQTTTYSTKGTQTLSSNGSDSGTAVTVDMTADSNMIGEASTTDKSATFNTAHIFTTTTQINGTAEINNNNYDTVKTNFIRVSNHAADPTTDYTSGTLATLSKSFTRTADLTSMLVLSQQLAPKDATDGSGADEVSYYFVVWLSETGTNQTAGATESDGTTALPNVPGATHSDRFFNGIVAFNSAQGAEVTATFNGYTAVTPDTTATS